MIRIFACMLMLDLISGVNSTCCAQPIVNVLSSLNADTLYRFYPNKIAVSGLRAGDIVRLSALRFWASGDTILEYRVANRYVKSDSLRITRGREVSNGTYRSYGKIKGSVIPAQLGARISSLKPGDRIYFDNVRMHVPLDKSDGLLAGSAVEIIN